MKLNRKQFAIVLVSAVLFVLMGLFPPWYRLKEHGNVGYGLITGRHGLIITDLPRRLRNLSRYRVNISRLLLQWAVLGGATAAALLLANGIRR